MPDVTRLLDAAAAGDPQAAADLLPLVYDELRKLAAARHGRTSGRARRSSRPPWSTRRTSGWSARPTAAGWDGRGHFFAAAAEAMRRILVEAARRKQAGKRGGGRRRGRPRRGRPVAAPDGPADDLLALDEALDRARGRTTRGGRAGQAPLLRRADRRGGRRRARGLPADGRRVLGVRPRLAARRAGERHCREDKCTPPDGPRGSAT